MKKRRLYLIVPIQVGTDKNRFIHFKQIYFYIYYFLLAIQNLYRKYKRFIYYYIISTLSKTIGQLFNGIILLLNFLK